MITKTIDVQESQINLEDILSFARQGKDVILTDASKPLAKLIPLMTPTTNRIPGLHQGVMQISDDFDNPLPEEFWTGGI